jgi:cytosine/adenosine deaminase-related metal-dependent hydrolase
LPSRFRASWLLPIAGPPVRDGWVAVGDGLVTAVGSGTAPDAIDLGRAVILPALVNAHTHLELAYLHQRLPAGGPFLDWIRPLMAARREHPDPADPVIVGAARAAIRQSHDNGTGLLGEVSNTLVTVSLLREAGNAAQVFYELLGFNAADPEARVAAARAHANQMAGVDGDVRISLAPHAPYSVSPAMFRAIRDDLDGHGSPVTSVHLGESAEEIEFLRRGDGGWRTLLEELGVWNIDWRAPGTSPVEYLSDLGFMDRCVMAVHGVQFDGEDLTRLAGLGVTIAACPRSNRYVGVGDPPLEAFYAMDVDVAFGTDSLASVADLSVFSELKEARRLAPRVPAARLLESATLTGARALGFEREFGSIEPGKRAALIAVRVPDGVADVEEYLLSGIEPGAITWLDHGTPNAQLPTPSPG